MTRRIAHWSRWFSGREEYVLETSTPEGNVVVRARLDASFVTIFAVPWRVEVRRKEDDPFGTPLPMHRLENRERAYSFADDVVRRMGSGEVP